jgi:hypothetical protein
MLSGGCNDVSVFQLVKDKMSEEATITVAALLESGTQHNSTSVVFHHVAGLN